MELKPAVFLGYFSIVAFKRPQPLFQIREMVVGQMVEQFVDGSYKSRNSLT
ncbi:hypothetical protein [Novosphingobium sp. THN1]|uniref:hypothetical protein n=1 Tax=Novosphingobium sp. THN1 TaxID=1016987 RepID=UPI0013C347A4|nr:hypothetical protein [Novosphingobium sp. THN1]